MFSRNAIIAAVLTLACLCRAEDQHLWAAPAYGKVDPREYMPQSFYTSCVFWACMNQNPTTFATWGVPDGSASRNNGGQTNVNCRPAYVTNANGSLSFDGIDDRVDTFTNYINGFTVTAWVYLINTGAYPNATVFTKGTLNGDTTSQFAVYYNRGLSNFRSFIVESNATLDIVTWTGRINKATWYFIATTHSATNLTLSVNGGTPVSTASSGIRNASYTAHIGNDPSSLEVDFYGYIDSLSVFGRQLSDAEISTVFAASKGNKQ